jgi:hypothetical protein
MRLLNTCASLSRSARTSGRFARVRQQEIRSQRFRIHGESTGFDAGDVEQILNQPIRSIYRALYDVGLLKRDVGKIVQKYFRQVRRAEHNRMKRIAQIVRHDCKDVIPRLRRALRRAVQPNVLECAAYKPCELIEHHAIAAAIGPDIKNHPADRASVATR